MKKAVFFDIDGTLIDVTRGMTQISKPVHDALKEVQAAGHYTFLASGRPLAYLDPKLLKFGFDGLVLMNGAVVVVRDEVIFDETIDNQIAKDICDICETEKIEYILQGHPKVYLRPGFNLLEKFYSDIDIDVNQFVRNFKIDDLKIYKMEFISDRPNATEVYDRLEKFPGLTGINDPFHLQNLELYATKNTKASGIIHALDYLGIDIKNSYAFGDGLNDIEMIQTVGTGIAMDNGNAKLKSLAKHIVPSVHEDGVAYGIRKYVLEEAL